MPTLIQGAPLHIFQDIIDQTVRIVHVLGDNNIPNADVRPDNFIVSRNDNNGATSDDYRVFMIDFGQSRLRRADEQDHEWGRAKWRQDEEGAVGLVMQHRLRKSGIRVDFQPSMRYLEFSETEDDDEGC
ncbi:hypothetical protein S40293_00167 [Stachybotrys chartarum IBT 40293]|nr:hypothetical protein S40293_00167 [Stachybotrys chartarum IBT 40293]